MKLAKALLALPVLVMLAPLWFAYVLLPDVVVGEERAAVGFRAIVGTMVLVMAGYVLYRHPTYTVGWWR